MLNRNGRIYRDRIVVVSEDEQTPFGELFDQINKVAWGLAMNGIREENWIAI